LETQNNMVYPEENNSCSFELDKSYTFTHDSDHTEVSENMPAKDSIDENEDMLYPTLDYINQILLEEDMNDQFAGNQEETTLSYIEKSFYDALEKECQPSPINQSVLGQLQLNNSSETCAMRDQTNVSSSTSKSLMHDSRIEMSLMKEFQRGMEEGNKFLPTINNVAINLHVSGLSLESPQKNHNKSPDYKLEGENVYGLVNSPRSRKKNNVDLKFFEGPNKKISMFYSEETIRDETFDKILLDNGEEYTKEEISHVQENQEAIIDLESLLIQCSEAVSRNNCKMAEDLIKEIRNQASPIGNGAQRLSCILSDGLEARLAGTGNETYHRLVSRRTSTREILKAYHMYITSAPVLRVSYYVANEHICKAAESASKIHIIDLGIAFGFQWPPLIQALAKRKGGPPKLRITGVDLPRPGFRPAEQIKQTGLRLEEYAKSFGVPFEYQCVASLWECISVDDLKIDEDEVLIVNSMFRFKQVRDETFAMDSPRNRVLNLIRHMKPKFFILGIFDVSFSPYFNMRFRKVLSHYSKLFDMFDTLVPRGDNQRQLMERELVAPSIMNLVACEGSNCVVRPEKHEQWHKRISRAGFEQLPMDRNIIKYCNEKVKSNYHEGFFIEEKSGWLLQGWRGSVDRALSMWKPKLE
jgi:GRAS domain family